MHARFLTSDACRRKTSAIVMVFHHAFNARRSRTYLRVVAFLFQLLAGLHDDIAHAGVAEDGDITARPCNLCALQGLAVPLLCVPCTANVGRIGFAFTLQGPSGITATSACKHMVHQQ